MNRTFISVDFKGNCAFSVQTNSPRLGRLCGAPRGGTPVTHSGDNAVALINNRLWEELPKYAQDCMRNITDTMQLNTAVIAYTQCKELGIKGCEETCDFRGIEFFKRNESDIFHRLWGELQIEVFTVSVKIEPYSLQGASYSMTSHRDKERSKERPVFNSALFSKELKEMEAPAVDLGLSPDVIHALNKASTDLSQEKASAPESTPDTSVASSDSSSSSSGSDY